MALYPQTLTWKSVLLLCLTFALASESFAKKLYKYQDKNGKWHFSDKPPKSSEDIDVQVEHMEKHEPTQKVFVQNRGSRQRPLLYVVNELHGPVEVRVSLTNSYNVDSNFGWNDSFVIPARGEKRIGYIKPKNPNARWSYAYNTTYTLGDPKAQPDQHASYAPPIPAGKGFRITQAFNGIFSHQDSANRYAVDIAMDVGTPVLASRGGVVMDIEEDFSKGGTHTSKLAYKANSVRILHDDGTMAIYAHLQLESIQVRAGDRVSTGQHIANSGNTGFSSGPHLHFAIHCNKYQKLESIPFKFSDRGGKQFTPQPNTILTGHFRVGAYR